MQSPKLASAERRATLLHTGARVAKSVASILDPDLLLRRTVDLICDEFGFYYAGVYLVDESGQWAVLRAGRGGAGTAMIAGGHKLEVGGSSMVGIAMGQCEARIALDIGEEAVYFHNPYLPETRSEMALPLIAGEEVIGALTVQSEQEAAFTKEDIETIQSMADQLAIAIKNARLHYQVQNLLHEAQRRAKLLQAANEVGKQAAAILDLDELLPTIVNILRDAYELYYTGIFLVEEGGEWAVLRAGAGDTLSPMMPGEYRLEVGGESMIGTATGLREARIALAPSEDDEDDEYSFNPMVPRARSEIALPLIVGDKLVGAVTAQSADENAFSYEDVISLQTMADHLAIAIHNALTLKELENAHAELLRTKTYEALTTATSQAIHWIGNKALPITTTVARMQSDLATNRVDLESWRDDLELIDESARLIVQVKEKLIGPAREQRPRAALLADVVQAAAFHTGVKSDQLTIDVAPQTPLVLADTTQLVRALSNLFENALEARATKIAVRIEPTVEAGYVSMSVKDDGDGIAPEMLSKVWAAFITTKGASHSGLGLPAALRVITQLDGRITLESQPREGTTVSILLPSSPEAPNADLSRAPERVLLIDDQDVWSKFVMSVLTRAGKEAECQPSVNSEASADCILVDETLTTAPISEVLKALQAANMLGKTTVVATAMNVERTTGYLKAGVKDVVLKPYTLAELATILL